MVTIATSGWLRSVTTASRISSRLGRAAPLIATSSPRFRELVGAARDPVRAEAVAPVVEGGVGPDPLPLVDRADVAVLAQRRQDLEQIGVFALRHQGGRELHRAADFDVPVLR